MAMYRGKKQYRKVHPKIFVWSHTQKAEIEYFQDFKNHLRSTLLMPKKDICWTPQELLEKITQWRKNNIKIAYTNECFELWILLHFMKPTSAISRGKNIEKKIQNEFKKHKLGKFKKNQKVFNILLQFQSIAVKNAIDILPKYNDNNWEEKLSERGNPSTSLHLLVDEINRHIPFY